MDFETLKKASKELVEFYKKNCNVHQSIIIDTFGVRVVSDEMFIPTIRDISPGYCVSLEPKTNAEV